MFDLAEEVILVEALAAKSRTAGETGSAIDLADSTNKVARQVVAYITCGTVTGTSPTLDVKFQDSADNVTYADVTGGGFTQLTAAGKQEISFKNTKRYLKCVGAAPGGSATPTFVYGVVCCLGGTVEQKV